ncbi:type II toxin-antitoxin system YhaV family toxin [Pseudothauera lacus]|uniref:type II toxin-antitoxin system YhaV family toxin n=1 Tax=Pseudothauera lacus TaxID=2136175 RepID=UPI001C62B829|nr:type II toxin-antitoxin system YhaV family toxin [Pseudothauera lacus]
MSSCHSRRRGQSEAGGGEPAAPAPERVFTGSIQKDPVGYVKKNASKRLVAITKLAFDVIPQDPTRPEYRQGATLGEDHKHWFRAKFFQQYRLFFRYHAPSKVIVYAWVNDEDTKRAYESSDDAYRVFRKMLESGHPPDDWDQLLAEARKESQRMQESLKGR